MTTSLVALCLFAGWALVLVTAVALFRGLLSSREGKALNTFAPDGADVGGLGQRLTRAHLNCVENLPVVAAVILAAAVAGRSDVTDPLAMPLLFARLAQSTVHLVSISVPMVMLRATLFVVQLLIVASWIVRLVF
jgi:uncharacterized MAPEG superfamily protein